MKYLFLFVFKFTIIKASNCSINTTEQVLDYENQSQVYLNNGIPRASTSLIDERLEQNNYEERPSADVTSNNYNIIEPINNNVNEERHENTYILNKKIIFEDVNDILRNEEILNFQTLFLKEIDLFQKRDTNYIFVDPMCYYPESLYNNNFLTIARKKHNIITERMFLDMLHGDPLIDIKLDCCKKLIDMSYGLFYCCSMFLPHELITHPSKIVNKINVLSFMPHLISTFLERHQCYCFNYSYNLEKAQKTFNKRNKSPLLLKLSTIHGLNFENYFLKKFLENITIFQSMTICDILFVREFFYIFFILEKIIEKNSHLLIKLDRLKMISPDFTHSIFKNTGSKSFFISFGNIMKPLTRLSTNKIEDIMDINKLSSNIDISDFIEPINDCSDNNYIFKFSIYQDVSIPLPHDYCDILLGLMNLYLKGNNQILLIQVKQISDKTSEFKVVETSKSGYIKKLKKHYKKCYRNNKLFEKDLEEIIKSDRCRHFSSILSMSTYTFEKNNNDSFYGNFYRLSCGHFIGLDLKKHFFDNLNHKCVLCNKVVGIKYYFKTNAYLLDGDNTDITLRKKMWSIFH